MGTTFVNAASAVAVILLVVACSDGETEAKPRPGLHFVAGASGVDTVEAILTKSLVAEYRDDAGLPLAYRDVFFQIKSLPNVDSTNYLPSLTLTFDAANASTESGLARTDVNGRITARVRLGQGTGTATVIARVSGGGSATADSASYLVYPGAPARVRLQPRDTALYPAARLEYRQAVLDRFRHPVTDPIGVTYLTNNDLTVSSSGIATPRNAGRDTVIARTGAFADTVLFTVLPIRGSLVASTYNVSSGGVHELGAGLATMNLDGSDYKEYAKTVSTSPFVIAYPRWSIDKKSLFARVGIGSENRIWTIPLDGAAPKKFLLTPTPTGEDFPSPSPDGVWVYYHIGAVPAPGVRLYRARVDGTGTEGLPEESPVQTLDPRNLRPQVSSSGEWVAYTETNGGTTNVRNISTGVRTPFNREAYSAAWAPTGTRLAYIKGNPGPLYTAEYDGSGDRLISAGYISGPLSWSIDGKYILAFRHEPAAGPTYYELIEVATGVRYKLPFNVGAHAVLKPYN